MIQQLNVKSKENIIKFDKLFSEDEFQSMREQIQNNKYKKWTDFFSKKEVNVNAVFKKNDSIFKLLSKYKTWTDIYKDKNFQEILRLKSKFIFSSIPVFNKDFSFAAIYIEYSGGGDLRIYKRVNNKWIIFGAGGLWTAD